MVLEELTRALVASEDLDALERTVRACLVRAQPAEFVEAMAVAIGYLERGGHTDRAEDLALLFALVRPELAAKREAARTKARTMIGGPRRHRAAGPSDAPSVRAADLCAATPRRLR
jgi:hypothetical protein